MNIAFDSLSQIVLLSKDFIPDIFNSVANCCNSTAWLFSTGKGEIRTQEDTSQGNTIAISMYTMDITPLILYHL